MSIHTCQVPRVACRGPGQSELGKSLHIPLGTLREQPAERERQGPAHRLAWGRGGAGPGGRDQQGGRGSPRRRKPTVSGPWQNQESGFPRSLERGAGRRPVAKPGARKPLLSLTQRLGTQQPPSAQRRVRSDPRRSLRSPSAPEPRPSPPPSSWPWSVRTSALASASPRTQPSSPTAPRRPGAAAVSAALVLAGRAPEVRALAGALPSKGRGCEGRRAASGKAEGSGPGARGEGTRRGAAGAAAAPLFRAARPSGRLR